MTSQRMLEILVAALGVLTVVTGLGLLFAPLWFFENIGNYPPFNRHYEGDLGAFVIGSGVGLLWAARDPYRYRALIGVALVANVLHMVNHVYDDLIVSASMPQIMQGAIPVGLQAALLGLALYLTGVKRRD